MRAVGRTPLADPARRWAPRVGSWPVRGRGEGWPLAHAWPPAAPALRPGRAPAWRSPELRLRRGGGRLLTIRPLPPVPRASWRRRLGGLLVGEGGRLLTMRR